MKDFPQTIEKWALNRLKPYSKNARVHSVDQVDQIAKSIERFGFVNPILVSGAGDVIAGHGRIMAAKKMGLPEVPVIVLDYLSEDERRALIIADNKIHDNSHFDFGLLREELLELDHMNSDVSLTGFDDGELEDLMTWTAPAKASKPEVDEEEPRPKKEKAKSESEERHEKPSNLELTYKDKDLMEFGKIVRYFQDIFETKNISETVLKVMRTAYDAAVKNA